MSAPSSPFFTVLIPTHNRADLLPRAVESVLAQTFDDFELLIVDDASTDRTPEVATAFDDPRVRYVRQEENRGVGATRNHGMHLARADLVSLLDDDDEMLPEFLEYAATTWRTAPAEVGLTWTGVSWVEDTADGETPVREELWQPSFLDREAAYRSFLVSRRIGTNCGLIIRRSAFNRAGGFDERLRGGAEDTDLLIRLVRVSDFRVIPHTLVKLHLHHGPNLRRVSLEKARDYERIVEKHRATLDHRPDLAAELFYKTGWLHYHAGDRRTGRRYILAALRYRPGHWRSWGALALFEMLGAAGVRLHRRLSAWKSQRRALSTPWQNGS